MMQNIKQNITEKKAQMVALDLVIGILIFILFVGIFIGVFFFFQNKDLSIDRDFEIEYIFANFENNLEIDQKTVGNNIDFLKDYRIDKIKLDKFFLYFNGKSIDQYVISNIGGSKGIGLSSDSYDSCIYFVDNDGSRLNIIGLEAIGQLKLKTCHEKISSLENPCDDYSQAISLLKPVLFDEGLVEKNRILQMNIVLCKI